MNPLHTLAELLRGGGAQPLFSPERLAPSTIYDLQYRLAITACAFELHAKSDLVNTRRIRAATLKLLQFVAIRPWLVPVLQEWAASQRHPQFSLLASQRLRRGFVGDVTYEAVIAFLVARRVLVRVGSHLVSGQNVDALTPFYTAAVEHSLFAAERRVLQKLVDVKITNSMLEGW
jgi:hypothetical protein